jgi:hypothetical protein
MNAMMIESYISLMFAGFAVVAFFAWWVDTKKKSYRREEEDIKPLVGVVLPKKKDEDANE